MDIIVTGFSKQSKKNAFIRIVVNDQDPNAAFAAVTKLRDIYVAKASKAMARYGIDDNRIKLNKADDKGGAALMFEVPIEYAESFLNEPFFGKILDACSKQIFKCNYSFDVDDVMQQIESPTKEESKEANRITNDFINDIFNKLDDPKVQQFLKSYCGNIKIFSTDTNGWEHMQYSPRNIAMIYAQFEPQGITPTFICSAREWARCFNRKIKDGAQGVVIEIPEKNKRFDAQAYQQKTNGRDYTTDMNGQGAQKLMALRGGHNQHDDVQGQPFYPGWVYDVSQTEIMVDDNGQPLDDYFNDTTIQRPNNILDLGQGFLIDTNKGTQIAQDTKTGQKVESPFNEHLDKIPQGMKNIREGMTNPKFGGMFDKFIPDVEQALKNPTQHNIERIIGDLARIQLYQIDVKDNQKEQYVNIVKNLIMCGMGYGDINQVANYARLIQQERTYNHNIYTKVWNIVRNITQLLNGQLKESIMIEQICKEYSLEDILNIFGATDEERMMEQKENIKKSFDKIMENLNRHA